MKFGDKLVELRKKNGYSQEELAEKLGVSRQSVSKWESNNTYPETDKMIQIANLFDCSLDDLINDKITDVDSTLRSNKNNVKKVWDSLLDFITNTVNMFSKMKFIDGLKCIIEMIIIGFLLTILGHIICNSASSIIANIFKFLSEERISLIREVLKSIFYLIWFVVTLITVIYTFKIKYLNNYEKEVVLDMKDTNNEIKKDKDKNESKNEVKKEVKKEKVVKTTSNNSAAYDFLDGLAKCVILIVKFITFWIFVGFASASLGLVISSVVMFAFIPTHIMFLWIGLMLVAFSIISIQITSLLISFIFNRKVSGIANLIIFICSIVLAGVGIGFTAVSVKDIEIVRDNSAFKFETKEIELQYKEDLVIDSNGLGVSNKYKYIIDNNIEDNKIIVSREVDSRFFKLYTTETTIDELPTIRVTEDGVEHIKGFFDFYLKNLKKNKVYTFEEYGNDPLVIKANDNTINNLITNLEKVYLIEKEQTESEINITARQEKVYFKNGLEGTYNAKDDTIKYDIEDYTCKKEIEKTEYGERFIYTCEDIEEE